MTKHVHLSGFSCGGHPLPPVLGPDTPWAVGGSSCRWALAPLGLNELCGRRGNPRRSCLTQKILRPGGVPGKGASARCGQGLSPPPVTAGSSAR